MFKTKKEMKYLKSSIKTLKDDVERLSDRSDYDLVWCAKCKCAIQSILAYKAPGVVKNREVGFPWPFNVEYIHHDYFCKVHKPKNKKEK